MDVMHQRTTSAVLLRTSQTRDKEEVPKTFASFSLLIHKLGQIILLGNSTIQMRQGIFMYKAGAEACIRHGPPKILNFFLKYIYNYFNIFKIQSTKIRVGPPKYLNQSNNALKKNNQPNSYRDITLFFAILFFIVKCVLISIKYLIKFGIKHV